MTTPIRELTHDTELHIIGAWIKEPTVGSMMDEILSCTWHTYGRGKEYGCQSCCMGEQILAERMGLA